MWIIAAFKRFPNLVGKSFMSAVIVTTALLVLSPGAQLVQAQIPLPAAPPEEFAPTNYARQFSEQDFDPAGILEKTTETLLAPLGGFMNIAHDIVSAFFDAFIKPIGNIIGALLATFIKTVMAPLTTYLLGILNWFVLNPNIPLALETGADPQMTTGRINPFGYPGFDPMLHNLQVLTEQMKTAALDISLILFILAIWRRWIEGSFRGDRGNLMGPVARLIFTLGLMLCWRQLYKLEIMITNEMVQLVFFQTPVEFKLLNTVLVDAMMMAIASGSALAVEVFAPVVGVAVGGLAGGGALSVPGAAIGGAIGALIGFVGLVMFAIFGGILIGQMVYLLCLKSFQTAILVAQYVFAPIFLVFFASPDTEHVAKAYVRSFVEVSLWSFIWLGLFKVMVIVIASQSTWGKLLIVIGLLQLMIQVPTWMGKAQIGPLAPNQKAIMGLMEQAYKGIANSANTALKATSAHSLNGAFVSQGGTAVAFGNGAAAGGGGVAGAAGTIGGGPPGSGGPFSGFGDGGGRGGGGPGGRGGDGPVDLGGQGSGGRGGPGPGGGSRRGPTGGLPGDFVAGNTIAGSNFNAGEPRGPGAGSRGRRGNRMSNNESDFTGIPGQGHTRGGTTIGSQSRGPAPPYKQPVAEAMACKNSGEATANVANSLVVIAEEAIASTNQSSSATQQTTAAARQTAGAAQQTTTASNQTAGAAEQTTTATNQTPVIGNPPDIGSQQPSATPPPKRPATSPAPSSSSSSSGSSIPPGASSDVVTPALPQAAAAPHVQISFQPPADFEALQLQSSSPPSQPPPNPPSPPSDRPPTPPLGAGGNENSNNSSDFRIGHRRSPLHSIFQAWFGRASGGQRRMVQGHTDMITLGNTGRADVAYHPDDTPERIAQLGMAAAVIEHCLADPMFESAARQSVHPNALQNMQSGVIGEYFANTAAGKDAARAEMIQGAMHYITGGAEGRDNFVSQYMRANLGAYGYQTQSQAEVALQDLNTWGFSLGPAVHGASYNPTVSEQNDKMAPQMQTALGTYIDARLRGAGYPGGNYSGELAADYARRIPPHTVFAANAVATAPDGYSSADVRHVDAVGSIGFALGGERNHYQEAHHALKTQLENGETVESGTRNISDLIHLGFHGADLSNYRNTAAMKALRAENGVVDRKGVKQYAGSGFLVQPAAPPFTWPTDPQNGNAPTPPPRT